VRRGVPRARYDAVRAAGGWLERLPAGGPAREVLRLLGSDLDGPDGPGIARALTVSLNTPRTHTKTIFSKLGVNTHRAAEPAAL
jgi:ATP/maltotriose-dependent transcriptional regulator MalT